MNHVRVNEVIEIVGNTEVEKTLIIWSAGEIRYIGLSGSNYDKGCIRLSHVLTP